MVHHLRREKTCLLVMALFVFAGLAAGAGDASAGTEDYIGEISWFAGNFAPRNWATCDGQILSISQNTALFSILGTTYGGNGINNFALPDMRGRVPMHWGAGPGLTQRYLGEAGGSEQASPQPGTVKVEPADPRSSTGISVVNSIQPHNNMQPYLGITCIINLYGIYPSRN